MTDLSKIFLFRLTHVENIQHVLQFGITHSSSPNRNPGFVSIGDSTLISSRSSFMLPNNRTLGEYIPFYFGYRMPMLYVIQKGFNEVSITPAENIIYCISTVQKIIDHNLDFIFSDGHAVDALTTFYYPKDVNSIDSLTDKQAIDCKYWVNENDLDLKRRKEAEFLILGDIPYSAIIGFAVFNEAAKNSLIKLGISDEVIIIRPKFYF